MVRKEDKVLSSETDATISLLDLQRWINRVAGVTRRRRVLSKTESSRRAPEEACSQEAKLVHNQSNSGHLVLIQFSHGGDAYSHRLHVSLFLCGLIHRLCDPRQPVLLSLDCPLSLLLMERTLQLSGFSPAPLDGSGD